MSEFSVKWAAIGTSSVTLGETGKKLQKIQQQLENVNRDISRSHSIHKYSQITRTLGNLTDSLAQQRNKIDKMSKVLENVADTYQKTEKELANVSTNKENTKEEPISQTVEDNEFIKKIRELLKKELGNIGTTGNLLSSILNIFGKGLNYTTGLGLGKSVVKAVGGFVETLWKEDKNWMQYLFGKWGKGSAVSGLADTSTKWSTIKSSLSKEWDSYFPKAVKTAGDKVKLATKWAGTALSAITNGVKNYEEFGTVKNTRFWEETIMETVVDIGIGALATAGATALLGASASAIAVGAVSVVAIWAVDWAVSAVTETVTGESIGLTEIVSDTILNAKDAYVEGKQKVFSGILNIGNYSA